MKRMINRATAGILSLLMLLSLFTGCASSGTIDIEDSGIAYAVWWNPWSGDSGDSSGSGNTSSGNIFGRSWIMSGSNTGTAANADTYADGTAKKDFKALVTTETNKDNVKTIVKSGVTNNPSGDTVYANSYGTIDVTHTNEGYVTLKLTRSATAKIKGAVDYTDSNGETTYYDWYMDKDKEYSVPMYFGDGSYRVTIFENTTGIKYKSKLSVSVDADLGSELAPFLASTMYADYAGSAKAAAKAKELTKNCKTVQEKINEIYNWVYDNIKYDKPFIDAKRAEVTEQTGRTGQPAVVYDLDTILSDGKGVCGDRAALMAGMLRSIGIPCKYAGGTPFGPGSGHAWIEVWNETDTYVKDGLTYSTGSWVSLDSTSKRDITPFKGYAANYYG